MSAATGYCLHRRPLPRSPTQPLELIMKRILITLALAASSLAHADATHAPKVYLEALAAPADAREAEIAGLFDRWNAALASGDAEQVTSLYAPDGVLEPTVSNEVRSTPAG